MSQSVLSAYVATRAMQTINETVELEINKSLIKARIRHHVSDPAISSEIAGRVRKRIEDFCQLYHEFRGHFQLMCAVVASQRQRETEIEDNQIRKLLGLEPVAVTSVDENCMREAKNEIANLGKQMHVLGVATLIHDPFLEKWQQQEMKANDFGRKNAQADSLLPQVNYSEIDYRRLGRDLRIAYNLRQPQKNTTSSAPIPFREALSLSVYEYTQPSGKVIGLSCGPNNSLAQQNDQVLLLKNAARGVGTNRQILILDRTNTKRLVMSSQTNPPSLKVQNCRGIDFVIWKKTSYCLVEWCIHWESRDKLWPLASEVLSSEEIKCRSWDERAVMVFSRMRVSGANRETMQRRLRFILEPLQSHVRRVARMSGVDLGDYRIKTSPKTLNQKCLRDYFVMSRSSDLNVQPYRRAMLRKLTWEAGIVFMKVKMQKKRQKRKWTRRTTNFVRKQSKTGARTGVNCTAPWSKIKHSEEESMLNFADELEGFLETKD